MRIKTLLLAGVASGVVLAAGGAHAQQATAPAQIKAGGALDITFSGQLRAGVVAGPKESISSANNGYGFYTNNRFFINVSGKDDGSLMEYGGRVRLRFDNGRGSNDDVNDDVVDRGWLFLRGGWGEVRMGNIEGPADNSKIGSFTIAGGTGGIDGDYNPAFTASEYTYTVPLSGASTKIVYYSPEIAGFQAGVSFAPDSGANGLIASTNKQDGDVSNFFEGMVSYKGSFAGVDLLGSVTASYGQPEDLNGIAPSNDDIGGVGGGLTFGLWGFNLGGSIGQNFNTGFTGGDVTWYNIGVGGQFGPAKLALEYSHSEGDDTEPTAIVLSATMGLMPGFSILSEVGYYDPDADGVNDGMGGLVALDVQF